MGMYDSINGEQVKCFPWAHFYNDDIVYSGGNLDCYGEGEMVPYKNEFYNYGKNFIILDIDEFPETGYNDYDFIIHFIKDGKVVGTYYDDIDKEILFDKLDSVVSYRGTLLNIRSKDDILNYINDLRLYRKNLLKLREHLDELFKKASKCRNEIAKAKEGSKEKESLKNKIEKIFDLMKEERERIKSDEDALLDTMQKWYTDISDIEDLIVLGEYLHVYNKIINKRNSAEVDDLEKVKNNITSLLANDNTLYQRYVKWQESDEYIKSFAEKNLNIEERYFF